MPRMSSDNTLSHGDLRARRAARERRRGIPRHRRCKRGISASDPWCRLQGVLMSLRGWGYQSLPVMVALLATASGLSGQRNAQRNERRLFEWRGDVDREVQVVMRGRDIWTRDIGNNERAGHREQVASPLPRQHG